ncbi:MAG: hypothetical protein VYA02_03580, partial [Planctomycetota bacterium]|nr:hypothetical protein [Planctomycetota bacterium]
CGILGRLDHVRGSVLHKGAAKDTVRSAGSLKVHHRTALDAGRTKVVQSGRAKSRSTITGQNGRV